MTRISVRLKDVGASDAKLYQANVFLAVAVAGSIAGTGTF
jgi:hypothetical protein